MKQTIVFFYSGLLLETPIALASTKLIHAHTSVLTRVILSVCFGLLEKYFPAQKKYVKKPNMVASVTN
jgi:hypothetical protein